MRTTIDRSGRLVVPSEARRQLGLIGGEVLDVRVMNGTLEISVAPTEMHLVEQDGVLVAVPDETLPQLTGEEVRRAIDAQRR